jgi:oxygen-independent coproporphyrinogen-3 oxidase
MRKIDETTLPKPKEKLEILKHMIDFLTHHGYKMVGMDHFAKPEDELFQAIEEGHLHRNFQGYTTKGGATLIGIGLTSIGEGEDFYAQNYKDMRQYEEAIDAGRLPFWRGVILNQDDIIRKEVIMDLMANFWLDTTRIEKQFSIDFEEYFKADIPKLQPFIDDGLLTYENKIIHINETGSMLIRNIAMSFDAYLAGKENKKIFSKTV